MDQQFIDPQQLTGIQMGQPVQQVFQNPQQPPASTVQAMNYQQPPNYIYNAQPQQQQSQPPNNVRMTADEFQRQVDALAEDKFKIRSRQVANDAIYAMKGVLNQMGILSNNNNQQPQQQQMQPSFWNSTWGDITKVGIGGAIGIGAVKMFGLFKGTGMNGGYTPSAEELNLVGEAVKTLFRK